MRFLIRLIGLLLFAGGFVVLVIDGTRSLADASVQIMPMADLLRFVSPGSVAGLQAALTNVSEALWNPAAVTVLKFPAGASLVVLGLLFLWAGRPSS